MAPRQIPEMIFTRMLHDGGLVFHNVTWRTWVLYEYDPMADSFDMYYCNEHGATFNNKTVPVRFPWPVALIAVPQNIPVTDPAYQMMMTFESYLANAGEYIKELKKPEPIPEAEGMTDAEMLEWYGNMAKIDDKDTPIDTDDEDIGIDWNTVRHVELCSFTPTGDITGKIVYFGMDDMFDDCIFEQPLNGPTVKTPWQVVVTTPLHEPAADSVYENVDDIAMGTRIILKDDGDDQLFTDLLTVWRSAGGLIRYDFT